MMQKLDMQGSNELMFGAELLDEECFRDYRTVSVPVIIYIVYA